MVEFELTDIAKGQIRQDIATTLRKVGEEIYAITIPKHIVDESGIKEGEVICYYEVSTTIKVGDKEKKRSYLVSVREGSVSVDELSKLKEQGFQIKQYGRPTKVRKRGNSYEITVPISYVREKELEEGETFIIHIDATKNLILIPLRDL